MSILKIENVTKNYGRHEVLKGVNLLLDKPGIVALVGSDNGISFNAISNITDS